ncbi:MAG TPA: hypothetical protein VGD60_08955 [Candidatus Acidoferrales bacterium]
MPKLKALECSSNDPLYGSAWKIHQNYRTSGIGTNSTASRNRRRHRILQLNAKRRHLIRGVASGLNVSEAGRAAGYGTAQSAHRAMNLIRMGMPELLEKCHFSAEKLLKNLIESLEATKTLHFSYRGVVLDSRIIPDHKIQLRAAIELLKLHGAYPTGRRRNTDPPDDAPEVIFNIVVG